MNRPISAIQGISRQRGSWLRCFLDRALKGHNFSRAAMLHRVLKGHDFSRAAMLHRVLKGHDFSRAAIGRMKSAALAAEGWFTNARTAIGSRAKPALLIAIATCIVCSSSASAKVESQGPIHLWRLHGLLVDPDGQPLPNVSVTLSRDNKIVDKTTTDTSGHFAFDHIYGHFQLHIDRTKYSPLDREVVVGLETADLARKMLYVIAGPGACSDDCSSVFTNKNEFQKTIQRNTQHHY